MLIVASVSCIYGLGSPEAYGKVVLNLHVGQAIRRDLILRHLVHIHYKRNDLELRPGTFRAKGDTLEVIPAYGEQGYRITMFGDEIERMVVFNALTGEILDELETLDLYPAKHFITEQSNDGGRDPGHRPGASRIRLSELSRDNRLLEASAWNSASSDREMLRELGLLLWDRELLAPHGSAPGGQPALDAARLHARRLPAGHRRESHDHPPDSGHVRRRPLPQADSGRLRVPPAQRPGQPPAQLRRVRERVKQTIYTSATPGPYEAEHSQAVVQQVIRPTGILDPEIEVRPVLGQVDNLLQEIEKRVRKGQRALVTTLTKRMAEDLADYLTEMGVKVHYLHSEIDTLERIDILRDLLMGVYDVGGRDQPAARRAGPAGSLAGGDPGCRQGRLLRSGPALIQTTGRAARHVEGRVIMYADRMTDSMRYAIDETNRRRANQAAHNTAHGIVPQQIVKQIRDLTEAVRLTRGEPEPAERSPLEKLGALPLTELDKAIRDLEKQMKDAPRCWSSRRPPCCATSSSSCAGSWPSRRSKATACRCGLQLAATTNRSDVGPVVSPSRHNLKTSWNADGVKRHGVRASPPPGPQSDF